MSRRWSGPVRSRSHQGTSHSKDMNMAGNYALQLSQLHQRCLNDAKFKLNILGYLRMSSDLEQGGLFPASHPPLSSYAPLEEDGQQAPETNTASTTYNIGQDLHSMPRQAQRLRQPSASAQFNGPSGWPSQYGSESPGTNLMVNMASPNGMEDPNSGAMGINFGGEMVDDELSAMSHILLGQQFMDMDRVITLDGTNFAIDLNNWQNI